MYPRATLARPNSDHVYWERHNRKWVFVLIEQWGSYYSPELLYRLEGTTWVSAENDYCMQEKAIYKHEYVKTGERIVFKTKNVQFKQDMYNELVEIELLSNFEALYLLQL